MNRTVIYKEDAIAILENYIMELEGWQEKCDSISQAKDLIADIPEIEAEPVRHGRWLEAEKGVFPKYCGKCSECGKVRDKENYCSNCGAKMNLEENHNGKY